VLLECYEFEFGNVDTPHRPWSFVLNHVPVHRISHLSLTGLLDLTC
jgi:hypothetical protein